MAEIDPAIVARLTIPEFLQEVMHTERELRADSFASVLSRAGLNREAWTKFETGSQRLSHDQWFVLAVALGIDAVDVTRRLHESILSKPALWVERLPDGLWQVVKKPMTSPRALRSGNTINADLNANRPALFYELSHYYPSPEEIISIAAQAGYLTPTIISHPPPPPPSQASDIRSLLQACIDDLPDERLPLLERVVDKFTRYPLKDLAQAYKHFSLSVTKK